MNIINSKKFFNDNDINKIELTVKEVEKKTSGEIVVIVAQKSSNYSSTKNFIALIFTLLFSLATLYFIPDIVISVLKADNSFINGLMRTPFGIKEELRFFLTFGVWIFIPLQIIIYFKIKFLLKIFPWIVGLFLTEHIKNTAVRKKALSSFYERGLHKTRDETGVLFLLSLLEKKVYILADKGIYEKISQETLDRYAKEISTGIKNKTSAESLINAIKDSGSILSKNFPIKPDDTNELSNSVIFE